MPAVLVAKLDSTINAAVTRLDKDGKLAPLGIEPVAESPEQFSTFSNGYVTRNMFVVTMSDPAKVESLISQMLEVGVNHVNGVEFETTEFKRHRESARELAYRLFAICERKKWAEEALAYNGLVIAWPELWPGAA